MADGAQHDLSTYRAVQTLVFLPAAAYAVWCFWWIATFPRDSHPYVRLTLAVLIAAVPLSIWIRDISRSRVAHAFASSVRWTAVIGGVSFGLFCAAWTGWLFTGPYSGPMSAEATLFQFVAATVGCSVAVLIAVEPALLDQTRPRIARGCVRISVLALVGYAVGWTAGLIFGQRVALAFGLVG